MKYAIYWRDTEAYEPGPPLARDVECDVAMIGGGYTALWTSHFLKKEDPNLEIRIVEAEFMGAGASGHNDGFVTPTIGHSLRTVVQNFGPDNAKAAYVAVGRSIIELPRFCRKHAIDAELEPNGFYLVATTPAQMQRLQHDIALAESIEGLQAPKLLGGEEIRRRIPSPVLHGAIPGGGALINPFKLVRGLGRVVQTQGVTIHEQTRALEVQRLDGRHRIVTAGGSIVARKLVYATNAYQHQFRTFKRQVLPVWSYVLVSEPLSDAQIARIPWPGREGFVEARNFIVFARLTRDNRLLVGGGPAPYYFGRSMNDGAHLRNDRLKQYLEEQTARFFPMLDDLRWEYAYGGCIAMTRDLVPQVGRLANDVFYGHGYCGNGIATTHTAGKALRDLILEKESLYTKLFFVRKAQPKIPPEPLAFVGARGLSWLLAAQDRRPSLVRWPRI